VTKSIREQQRRQRGGHGGGLSIEAAHCMMTGTLNVPGNWPSQELMMNLAFALDQLQKARRITTDGHSCMVKQRKTIARLEREGRDTTEARLVLQSLEEMQARYETLRDRVETQVLALVKPTEDD
jgi:hypothetical protein